MPIIYWRHRILSYWKLRLSTFWKHLRHSQSCSRTGTGGKWCESFDLKRSQRSEDHLKWCQKAAVMEFSCNSCTIKHKFRMHFYSCPLYSLAHSTRKGGSILSTSFCIETWSFVCFCVLSPLISSSSRKGKKKS